MHVTFCRQRQDLVPPCPPHPIYVLCLLCCSGAVAVAPLVCNQTGVSPMFKVICTGFLPHSPPGVLIAGFAPNGVTLTDAKLQGGDIFGDGSLSDGRIYATTMPTSLSGNALVAGYENPFYDMVQVSGMQGSCDIICCWPSAVGYDGPTN